MVVDKQINKSYGLWKYIEKKHVDNRWVLLTFVSLHLLTISWLVSFLQIK